MFGHDITDSYFAPWGFHNAQKPAKVCEGLRISSWLKSQGKFREFFQKDGISREVWIIIFHLFFSEYFAFQPLHFENFLQPYSERNSELSWKNKINRFYFVCF